MVKKFTVSVLCMLSPKLAKKEKLAKRLEPAMATTIMIRAIPK
jgi:hypothetical protein